MSEENSREPTVERSGDEAKPDTSSVTSFAKQEKPKVGGLEFTQKTYDYRSKARERLWKV